MARSRWWENHRLLVMGCKGKDVKDLKVALNRWFPVKLQPTDIFDQKTKDQVKKFQKLTNLLEDGKVGPITHSTVFGSHHEYTITKPPVVHQQQYLCWAGRSGVCS